MTVHVIVRVAALAAAAVTGWQPAAPLPVPRSEVAAAAAAGRIVVAGGFLADGRSSSRVDAYLPVDDRWTRLPDLPIALNHAMAAASAGRLYVVGGYVERIPQRSVFVLDGRRWTRLPLLPAGRAAGGAAVAWGKLYVVGGVGPAGLARQAFVLDLARLRWSSIPGPTPREHLGATALGGRVYAVGGRTAGLDTNLDLLEAYQRGRGWTPLARVPEPRGGTGAAAIGSEIVSAGGEAPAGTIAAVYAYNVKTGRWRRLPDLLTPRHGLGVVALGGRIYAVAGGTEPGLSVSGATELLAVR